MIAYKKKCGLEAAPGVLVCGERHYQQFMSRHQSKVESAKGYRKDNNRHKFSTCFMSKQMFDCIYGKLKEGGIIEQFESPVLMNKSGDVVDTEDGACGLPKEFKLLWPHLVNFMDETGCIANQKKDGQIGRSHHITEKGCRVELQAITSDVGWTVLPIHNARGGAICCVITFQSDTKNIPFNWTTDIDPTVDVNPDMLNTE